MKSLNGCPEQLLIDCERRSVSGASSDLLLDNVGRKALGVVTLPAAWRPPSAVLSTTVFARWLAADSWKRQEILEVAAAEVANFAGSWIADWPRGLILRSSATTETLEDRGSHTTLRLARDFGSVQVADALAEMFTNFMPYKENGQLAVLVQPLAADGQLGHLSNERRVSKTINQWECQRTRPQPLSERINSQRDAPPDTSRPLVANTRRQLTRLFRAVGRWVTLLNRGPAHLEWTYDGHLLLLLQIDFEHEMPDAGVDPAQWLRDSDHKRPGRLPPGSPFELVSLGSEPSPWKKIENVKAFLTNTADAYPPLLTITGDKFLRALSDEPVKLRLGLNQFAHDRVVCRTDCRAKGIRRENLPRTNTISSSAAILKMAEFLEEMRNRGAAETDVCFIAHKFIPAHSGAWVRADPDAQIVVIDSLWGVPDGLQYLAHDTFQYDMRKHATTSERLRYKARFIQEGANGVWKELRVKRSLARGRSLAATDVREIAEKSHRIARSVGSKILIMWFCGIPAHLGIGRNLPWFRMQANDLSTSRQRAAPRWPKIELRTIADVDHVARSAPEKCILVLEPELDLLREDRQYLDRVIELAKEKTYPVQLAGSTLAHAYYLLEKEGVSVVSTDDGVRPRARSKKNYAKLVRDNIPQQIESKGEIVVKSKLTHSEMRRALVAKLMEEALELIAATDPDDVKSELADLLEVLRAIANTTGVAWGDVVVAADNKRDERGGFDEGSILVATAWPSLNPSLAPSPLLVSLRKLARIIHEDQKFIVPFNALVINGLQGVTIELPESSLRLTMTRDGIAVEAQSQTARSRRQMELPLNYTE